MLGGVIDLVTEEAHPMNRTRPTIRRVGAIAGTLLCLAVWHPASVEPQAADPVAQAGQVLEAGRVDDAIAMFEKAVAADPNDPAALVWLGSAQVRKAREASMFTAAGWVNKGFTTMDQAVKRFPSAFIVYVVRGITATRVPDFFKKAPVAVQDLSSIVAMKQKDPASVPDVVMPAVYLHLGRAYKKNDQAAEARAAWEKGKSAYPGAPETPAIDKELQETRP
jgi:tetratricopeptide (TPR) repeat protein